MATWRAYLAVGLAAVIVAALLPVVPAFWLAQVVTLSALPMVIHRVRKAGGRTPWTLLALSTAFFCGATVVRAVHSSMTGDPFPFPSPADGLYYCGYLFLLGVAIGIHRQRRDPRATSADLLDALIVASGVGMVVWGFVMSPYSRNGDLPTFERLLNGGYSFFDLALIAVVARIAVATNARNGAYRLLAGCFAMVVVTDVLATMATVSSAFAALAGLASVLCFLFAGAAALHGDAGTLLTRVEPKRATLSRRRLGLLVLALAMGPLVLLVRDLAGHPVDTVTVVGGSSLLCSLVLARMALLVKENERRAAAERMLRSAEEALVTATSRDDMLAAALAAALALVGDGPDTSVALADQHADGLAVAASTGGGARSPANEHANVLTIPLVSQNEVRGALIVTTKDPVRYDVAESLGDLAAVVALALESAARIAELHRQRSERRFRALIENSSDIVAILDSAGRFSFISGAVETMLGYSVEDLLCTSPLRLVHGTDKKRAIASLRGVRTAALTDTSGTIRVRHRDGSWRQMEITAQDLSHDSDVEGLVLNCRDVTERNRLETELRHQALHDALTGLANRVLFSDRVDHAVAKRGTAATGVAVLFVDLDDF
ncbi:MAG TPA: PAS domain S-box protein, partial [Acidimicrobiales bacterium]